MLLPSCLSSDDSATLINHVIHSVHVQSSVRVLGTAVISERFISSCLVLFDDIMQQKAQAVRTDSGHIYIYLLAYLCWRNNELCVCVCVQEVKSDPVLLLTEDDVKLGPVIADSSSAKRDKREERRKKASGGK